MTESGQVNEDNLASLEREISNHFYVVKDILKTESSLKKYFGYILEDILSKYFEFGINCLVRMANNYQKKHEEAKTKGHNGFQISYLQEAITMLKLMDRESFADKKALAKRFEPLKKQLEEVMLMNDQVYKSIIPKRDELNDIKELQIKVRPLEPKNIRVSPPESSAFASFPSEEMENIKTSLKLFISNKKQHIEKTFYDLKERLSELNKNYNIPFLANCANLNGDLSEDMQKKIATIKEKGEKSITDLISKAANERHKIENLIGQIDKCVAQETEKDKQALQMIQNGNYSPFVQSEAEILNELQTTRGYFKNYKDVEEKCHADYESLKAYLPKLINSSKNISMEELAGNSEIIQFVKDNKDKLSELKKYADGVDMLINKHLKTDIANMMSVLTEIDVDTSCQKILMNETDCATIFKNIDEKLGSLVQQFEEKVTKVQTPLDKVKNLAILMQPSMPKNSSQGANQLLVAVDFFFVRFKITLGCSTQNL